MRVFITGATGLLGSHVAAGLRERGDAVRALVRPRTDARHLHALGCEAVAADMLDPIATIAALIDGCDAVVHAAALVGARASRDRYIDANVRGTSTIMQAATRAGVARALHVSSVAVYGPIDGAITEDRWTEVDVDERAFYAWSKRAAEIEAWKHDDPGAMRVTTVRPSLIYGERDRHVAPRLDRLARLPVLPLPDGGRHVLPLVYAGNVAAGVIAALHAPAAAGRAYNLAHDNDSPLRDVVRHWCTASGRRPPVIPSIPGAAIEGAGRAIDWLSRTIPGIDLPGAERPARLVRHDNPYDSTRARRELGWIGLVPIEEAIARTVQWLHDR